MLILWSYRLYFTYRTVPRRLAAGGSWITPRASVSVALVLARAVRVALVGICGAFQIS